MKKKMSNDEELPSRKRQRICILFKDLAEDAILVVFRYICFPGLCRIKTVSKWWKKYNEKSIVIRLGEKPFQNNAELVHAVHDYCTYKQSRTKIIIDCKVEKLATLYGWPIGKWDVSQVTNFSRIFEDQIEFNECIGDWNVSNGTNFRCMFSDASDFDQDIQNWNVSKGKDFHGMFRDARSFNRSLIKWDTSSAEEMSYMFYQAFKFNGDVSNFNTSKVIDMHCMFMGALDFNQDISRWDTRSARIMYQMFEAALSFNQNISGWNTSNVTDMSQMFVNAIEFCQDLSSWDTSSLNFRESYTYEDVFASALSFLREYSPRF
mmetsp:Transcript_22165/g.33511  ORF Transcript_22165/g.33511 Transcript_22165/m.33511 type:complete len:320 (-) Transcript_22165:41-1000(-)